MKNIKRIIAIALVAAYHTTPLPLWGGDGGAAYAQPQKTRVQRTTRNATDKQSNQTANSRAALMFPTAVDVPEEVVWRRDVYRTLDLQQNENAALYFPVEPQGKEMNLFTLLFKLLNTGKIPAYQFTLDGNENFQQSNRLHFKDMLERYGIPYEIVGNSINVEDVDIPSAEVLSYYVKESSYYDQNTATYHSRVTALCPVLHRSDEFSFDSSQKYPLFWVKYDDIKNYLSAQIVMVSNLNNAATMSLDDFFATNHYKGKIYKTTNMQGKTLQEQFPTDSLMKREQNRIEKQMADFEKHIWKTPVDSLEQAKKDSLNATASKAKSKRPAPAEKKETTASRTSRRGTSSSSTKKEKPESSSNSSSSSPRVSVRRQRH